MVLWNLVAALLGTFVGHAEAAANCPSMSAQCGKFLLQNATWTGNVAIVVTGHIRTAALQLPTLVAAVELNRERGTHVDVFYHVWHDVSSQCEVATLALLEAVAAAVVTEPAQCAWSYGQAWPSQWKLADRAVHTIKLFGSQQRYGLVMKTRTDVVYDDVAALDFRAIWARYAPRARPYGGHFIVVGARLQGSDVQAIATPALMRVYASYRDGAGLGCDSKMDSFVWQRMQRFGVWLPPAELNMPATYKMSVSWSRKDLEGSRPPCAPLFVDSYHAHVHRSKARHMNENKDPGDGCIGRRRLDAHADADGGGAREGRRLAAQLPATWVFPDNAYCTAHQFDVRFYNASRLPTPHSTSVFGPHATWKVIGGPKLPYPLNGT